MIQLHKLNLRKFFKKKSIFSTSIWNFSKSESKEVNEKYRFPMNIFMVFEKIAVKAWTSDNDVKFDYYIYSNPNNIHSLFVYLKKHTFSNLSYLVDITFLNTPNSLMVHTVSNLKDVMGVWTLYVYNSRVRLNIVSSIYQKNPKLRSIDSVYDNANWLERESCEMYGTNLSNKGDSRRLLLNYFDTNSPMNKDLVSSNNYSVLYSFLDRQINYTDGARSEL